MIRHIVSCSDDQTVRVWAVASWQQEALLAGHSSYVIGVDVSRDGR
jgi:WD40 repeat protein